MMAMAPVHEEVHERASSKHQEWQDSRQMGAVPDHEIPAQDNGEAKHGPTPVGLEATEHSSTSFVIHCGHHAGGHVVEMVAVKRPCLARSADTQSARET